MADPIPIRILDYIQGVLEDIDTDDLTISEVHLHRPQMPDVEQVSTAYARVMPGTEKIVDRWAGPGAGIDTWSMPVVVFVGDVVPDTMAGDLRWPILHASRMRHAVQTAVLDDPTLGGIAEATEASEVHWFPEAFQGFDSSVAVVFDVTFTQFAADSTQVG